MSMNRFGFSLIEVNIAILVIAGGLLSLFSLFPAGLRMSSAALSDTRQALFADDFFSYFDDGVRQIADRNDWQNVEKFWKAAREGLEDGFNTSFNDKDWNGNDEVQKDWGVEPDDFKKGSYNSDGSAKSSSLYLRFRNGVVPGYFVQNKSKAQDKLDAEFVVRIASEYGEGSDGLIWRVSLIVSDDGTGGWFYNNPVYHKDFRYAELP